MFKISIEAYKYTRMTTQATTDKGLAYTSITAQSYNIIVPIKLMTNTTIKLMTNAILIKDGDYFSFLWIYCDGNMQLKNINKR